MVDDQQISSVENASKEADKLKKMMEQFYGTTPTTEETPPSPPPLPEPTQETLSPQIEVPLQIPTSPQIEAPLQTPASPQMSVYGKGLETADLKQALAQQQQAELGLGLAQAGQTIGSAISGAKPVDLSPLQKLAGRPAESIVTQRKAVDEELKAEKQVLDNATEKDKMKVDSDISKLYRDVYKRMSGTEAPSNATAASLEKMFPSLEKYFASRSASLDRANNLRIAQINAEATKSEKKAQHAEDKQRDMFKSGMQLVSGGRVGKDLIDAKQAIRRSDLALTAFKEYPEDLNQMPHWQAAAIQSDLASILQGGAPTIEILRTIQTPTFNSDLQKFWGKVKGTPTAAELGGFLTQQKRYLEDLKNTSQKYINRQLKTRLEPFEGEVSDNQFDKLMKIAEQTIGEEASGPTAATPNTHPQDNEAVTWAKANPSDPRSKTILNINGQ